MITFLLWYLAIGLALATFYVVIMFNAPELPIAIVKRALYIIVIWPIIIWYLGCHMLGYN